MRDVERAVSRAGRWLASAYALDLDFEPGDFVIRPEAAEQELPRDRPNPRSGLVAVEKGGVLRLGLYLDERDRDDMGTILEETSHLVCLAWHAERDLPVSCLVLEIQADVDRFLYARACGADPLAHFERFRWADWLDDETRARYETAHAVAGRYCRHLARRFRRPSDTEGLLSELRRFYRASPQAKMRRILH